MKLTFRAWDTYLGKWIYCKAKDIITAKRLFIRRLLSINGKYNITKIERIVK